MILKTDNCCEQPMLINGGSFNDERGMLNFINEFTFNEVKRFYTITHTSKETIRAWQGHINEKKYFYVINGSFIISWVKIDNWENPSSNLQSEFKILDETDNKILSIPRGYANGLKAVEDNSRIMIFSNLTLDDSLLDNHRYDKNLWLKWNQIKKKND